MRESPLPPTRARRLSSAVGAMLLYVLLLWGNLCMAQVHEVPTGPLGWGLPDFSDELSSDRPDFTEAVSVIDLGHLQIESGYTFTHDRAAGNTTTEHTIPEFLLRLGLWEGFEGRLSWVGYEISRSEGATVDGLSDLGVGFKQALLDGSSWQPNLSLIGTLFVPSGGSEVTQGEPVPEAKLVWNYELEAFEVTGNINYSAPEGQDGRFHELGNSVSVSTGLTDTLGFYLEYFGLYPVTEAVETDEHYVDGGFTWLSSPNVQWDVRLGVGLNAAAADLFTGVGLVVRY